MHGSCSSVVSPESEQDVRHCHGGELGRRESRDSRRNVSLCEFAQKKSSIVCVILGEWGELEGALCFTHSGSRGGWRCSLVVQ